MSSTLLRLLSKFPTREKLSLVPIIEEVGQEYDGKAVVGKVDVDANQQFAAKYGVRNIPTVLVFKDGEVINRQVGVSPKKVYTDAIDAAL